MIGIAWMLSEQRRRFPWRVVAWGLGLQFVFAFLILRTAPGKQAFNDFLEKHYHQPSDDLKLPFDWVAGAKFAEVNYSIVRAIANEAELPRWYADSFFGKEFAPGAVKAVRPKP